jgi:Protein of unknown function (DUF1501)
MRNARFAVHGLGADFNPDRRSFMAQAASRLLGVSLAGLAGRGLFGNEALAQEPVKGKAKSVIYLYMAGAMSHLDTFDPKPGAKSQGETKTTKTKVPGIEISDQLPKIAELINEIAIVRSLTTLTGAHEQGNYFMHTSYNPLNSIRHPAMGAWANKLLPRKGSSLPSNVLIGSSPDHPGAGFLPASLAPVPISNPAVGLENTQSPNYLTEDQFKERMSLASQYDQKFKRAYDSRLIDAYDQTYREAVKLMASPELKVFDIKQEDEKVRKQYGEDRFGQGCLLARRLVKAGVRFIEVEFGGWDHHQDIYDRLPAMVKNLDTGLSALIQDLKSSGLLDTTLIVLATEFGRTPSINENAGRDHHPGVFSGLFCGAGIRGGTVLGKSDKIGASPEEDGILPTDFNATIASVLGLPLDKEFTAPNGRPFKICDAGKPIKKILI